MVAVLHEMIKSQICGRETEFIAKTEWIRNRKARLKEPLRGIKPMIHVNTLSFHVELCHGNLVAGQVTGLSHSIFKNTRIYGQINWVQLHLVLLGWIPPPLFLSVSTSPLSYLLFCKVLCFKRTRSISISSCVSRTECLIYLSTKPPGLSKAKITSYYMVSSPQSLKYISKFFIFHYIIRFILGPWKNISIINIQWMDHAQVS